MLLLPRRARPYPGSRGPGDWPLGPRASGDATRRPPADGGSGSSEGGAGFSHLESHDNEGHQPTLNRIQANVHRELSTVLAESDQRETGSHRPHTAFVREAQAVADVRHAIPFGHEGLDNLTVERTRRILEQAAGRIGGEQNGARLPNDQRAVPRVRQESFEIRGEMQQERLSFDCKKEKFSQR